DGVGYSRLFSTHPPLLERIKALDPQFDPAALQSLQRNWAKAPPDGLHEDRVMGLDGAGARAPLPAAGAQVALTPEQVIGQVGDPEDDDYRRAGVLAASIPSALRASAASQDGAVALVIGLLLDAAAAVRARQVALVAEAFGATLAGAAEAQAAAASGLHPLLRLPLVALAFPMLRRRPRTELARLVACVRPEE